MKIKKIIPVMLLAVSLAALWGCQDSKVAQKDEEPSIYFYNSRPGQDKKWQKVAAAYTEATGVSMKVVSIEPKDYETRLQDELLKADAPTLFDLSDTLGYETWKDYCYNLKDTLLYDKVLAQELIIAGEDDGFYGIPYDLRSYGILCNRTIMQQYFQMDGAVRTSLDEIKSYADLKAVVEDMSQRTKELGIRGVFASTSLAPGNSARWERQLLNVPCYYELRGGTSTAAENFTFAYSKRYKNLFDLYLQNSCTDAADVGTKSEQDSIWEFSVGRAVMMQADNRVWNNIEDVEDRTVKGNEIALLPIYIGIEGEENQGLCTGTQSYFAVNSQASQEDIDATIDFLTWLFASEEGEKVLVNDLYYISAFESVSGEYNPSNPLSRQVVQDLANPDTYPVTWNYEYIPEGSQEEVRELLLSYAKGDIRWKKVKRTILSVMEGSE